MKEVTTRDWPETQKLWRQFTDRGMTLMQLPARSKMPSGPWGHIKYRRYEDIGFNSEDNAAVITNNIIVLDVDNVELFSRNVPETFTVKTGKGFHYYYMRPDDSDYRLRSSKAEGFDIRANGGYVVAPGSIHPNGSLYEIVNDIEMVIAPDWLLNLSIGGNLRTHHYQKPLGELPEVDLDKLDADTQHLIIEGVPVRERSEVIHKVMHRMVAAGYDREEIISAFLSNAIGEKANEKNNPESWLSNELDRVMTGKELKELRTIRIPESKELRPEFKALAECSHRDLIEMIRDYGNRTSKAHEDVLYSLMLTYASMAQGILKGRIAAPLPTGFGKTTSIVTFLSRAYGMHMLGSDFTMAIAASKVEQLCELHEALVKAGVPQSLISLVHHKKYDPEIRLDENGQLPSEYASVQATKDESGFITDRPILLVTHNKVMGQRIDERVLASRTFTIWDESLLSTKASGIDMKDLNLGVAAFGHIAAKLGVSEEVVDSVKECLILIEQNISEQRRTGRKSMLKLPLWTAEIAKDDVKRVIKAERHIPSAKAMETLVDLFDSIESDMSVYLAQTDETLISFEVVVPDSLVNIVILDASTTVNELMLLDNSIYIPENFPAIPVSYVNTTVNRLDHRAGRKAIEESLQEERLKAAILEIIDRHPQENILLFTYKHRDGKVNHRKAIEEYLTENGIDVQERIDGKARFNWLTHGNETASNKYSHCTVAIFVGILYENEQSYVSKTVGQMRDHTAVVNASDITKVRRGSQVQAVQQGANRCASRIIKDDEAGAVTVYYTYPDDTLTSHLRCVLPDADFRVYDSDILQPRTQKHQMVKMIASVLMNLPGTIRSISSRALNQLLPELASLSKQHRSRVMALVNDDQSIGWSWKGRSLLRAGAQ